MEGMILTGPYLSICDLYRSHRREGLITGLVVIQVALVAKMLIEKPFIVVEISDSDRVILDIIKFCLPQQEGGGGVEGVQIKNGMSHVTIYPDHHQYSVEFLCLFLKPHFAKNSGGVAKCGLIFQSTASKAIPFFK